MEKYAFTIEWKNGSINDNIVKFLKANRIEFHYNHFFNQSLMFVEMENISLLIMRKSAETFSG